MSSNVNMNISEPYETVLHPVLHCIVLVLFSTYLFATHSKQQLCPRSTWLSHFPYIWGNQYIAALRSISTFGFQFQRHSEHVWCLVSKYHCSFIRHMVLQCLFKFKQNNSIFWTTDYDLPDVSPSHFRSYSFQYHVRELEWTSLGPNRKICKQLWLHLLQNALHKLFR